MNNLEIDCAVCGAQKRYTGISDWGDLSAALEDFQVTHLHGALIPEVRWGRARA